MPYIDPGKLVQDIQSNFQIVSDCKHLYVSVLALVTGWAWHQKARQFFSHVDWK